MSKISYIIKKYNILDALNTRLKRDFNIHLQVGIELEFYLINKFTNKKNISQKDIVRELEKEFSILIHPESGKNQFEVILEPTVNISEYAEYIIKLKQDIVNFSTKRGFDVLFASKPFREDFGSAMHVNLCCDNFSIYNTLIANILCSYLKYTKKFFLNTEQPLDILNKDFMSPTHICYGNSTNRSVMIRIMKNRLEHRLPRSDSDPYEVFYAILISLLVGLSYKESVQNFPMIFGNAFDPQYHLQIIR